MVSGIPNMSWTASLMPCTLHCDTNEIQKRLHRMNFIGAAIDTALLLPSGSASVRGTLEQRLRSAQRRMWKEMGTAGMQLGTVAERMENRITAIELKQSSKKEKKAMKVRAAAVPSVEGGLLSRQPVDKKEKRKPK